MTVHENPRPCACRSSRPLGAERSRKQLRFGVERELLVHLPGRADSLGGRGGDREGAAATTVEDEADHAAAEVALEPLTGTGADVDSARRLDGRAHLLLRP